MSSDHATRKTASFQSRLLILAIAIALFSSYVLADNELRMFSTKLNWFDGNDTDSTRAFNRTLLVSWTGGVPADGNAIVITVFLNQSGNENITSPFNFTIANNCGFNITPSNCTCNSTHQRASCTLGGNATLPFGVTWNGTVGPLSAAELSTQRSSANATNGSSTLAHNAANLTWLRIPESKVWHTLVEFGRGRGNYFYDSAGRQNSASVGTGVPRIPADTRVELNYLHKAFNVRQYFNLPTEKAENATWTCLYPNSSIVRSHLVTSIQRAGGVFNSSFKIPEIEGSFERQGYLGQQFEASEVRVGTNLSINCTKFSYTLGNASGNISVDNHAVYLTGTNTTNQITVVATRPLDPLNPDPGAYLDGSGNISNGTHEVWINYTIKNTYPFAVKDLDVEIGAPLFSRFIGVQGQLWGTMQDRYVVSRKQLDAGQSISITLVASTLFIVENAPADLTYLNLTGPSSLSFVAPWDANAYNPAVTRYNFQNTNQVEVNMTPGFDYTEWVVKSKLNEAIANTEQIRERVENLTNITNSMNRTISAYLLVLNYTITDRIKGMNSSLFASVGNITSHLMDINLSLHSINSTLVSRLVGINTSLQDLYIINQTLVDRLVGINLSVQDLYVINRTLVSRLVGMNISLQDLYVINQTLVDRLAGINLSVQDLYVINRTLVSRLVGMNASLQDLYVINQTLVDRLTGMNASTFAALGNITDLIVDLNLSIGTINQTLVDRMAAINVSLQAINVTLVDRVLGMNNSLIKINESLFNFLTAFNTTTFGQLINLSNVTAETNRSIGSILTNTSSIRVRLDRIEEFENELVFLVTDSFGAEQAAVQAVREERIGDAVDSMKQVNSNLAQISNRIAEERFIADTQPLEAPPVAQAPAPAAPEARRSPRGAAAVSGSVVADGSGFDWATTASLAAILMILVMVIHHHRELSKSKRF